MGFLPGLVPFPLNHTTHPHHREGQAVNTNDFIARKDLLDLELSMGISMPITVVSSSCGLEANKWESLVAQIACGFIHI